MHRYILQMLYNTLTFTYFRIVFILSLVEGSEEEKMETDSDGQQLEKVKAVQMSHQKNRTGSFQFTGFQIL